MKKKVYSNLINNNKFFKIANKEYSIEIHTIHSRMNI
jgi:hypothetical protein